MGEVEEGVVLQREARDGAVGEDGGASGGRGRCGCRSSSRSRRRGGCGEEDVVVGVPAGGTDGPIAGEVLGDSCRMVVCVSAVVDDAAAAAAVTAGGASRTPTHLHLAVLRHVHAGERRVEELLGDLDLDGLEKRALAGEKHIKEEVLLRDVPRVGHPALLELDVLLGGCGGVVGGGRRGGCWGKVFRLARRSCAVGDGIGVCLGVRGRLSDAADVSGTCSGRGGGGRGSRGCSFDGVSGEHRGGMRVDGGKYSSEEQGQHVEEKRREEQGEEEKKKQHQPGSTPGLLLACHTLSLPAAYRPTAAETSVFSPRSRSARRARTQTRRDVWLAEERQARHIHTHTHIPGCSHWPDRPLLRFPPHVVHCTQETPQGGAKVVGPCDATRLDCVPAPTVGVRPAQLGRRDPPATLLGLAIRRRLLQVAHPCSAGIPVGTASGQVRRGRQRWRQGSKDLQTDPPLQRGLQNGRNLLGHLEARLLVARVDTTDSSLGNSGIARQPGARQPLERGHGQSFPARRPDRHPVRHRLLPPRGTRGLSFIYCILYYYYYLIYI